MLYIRSLGVEPSYRSLWKYDAVEDTQTSTPLPATTSDIASNTQHDAISTDTLTPPLFEITSLPPATTTPQVLPKLPYYRQVNILYLIPLFIALGVVLGAITAAILLKCRENRTRLRRTSTLLPGPPYSSRENDVEDRLLVHGPPSMEQVSLFAASTPSKFTVHGSRYVPQRMLGWKALDGTQALPVYSQSTTIIPSSDGETFTVVTHEDPFTLPPLNGVRESTETSGNSSLSKIRVSPSLPHTTSEDNSNFHQTQEANLAKPFRRSMFDILKRKGRYRPVPSLDKEDAVLVPDEKQVDKTSTDRVRRVSSVKATTDTAGASRPRSMRRSLDSGPHANNVDDDDKQDSVDASEVLPKQVFRIKQGRISSPSLGETSRPRNVIPFASEISKSPKEVMHNEDHAINQLSGDDTAKEKQVDNYTRAPQRRRTRTPLKRPLVGSTPRRSSAPDDHASVLPLSPPLVMSPPLEKSLFFTSSLSSSASLAGRMHTLAAMSTPSLEHCVDGSPSPSLKHSVSASASPWNRKTRAMTANTSSPMPFPSYPNHISADRNAETTAAEMSTMRATHSTSSVNAHARTHPPWRSGSPGSPSPKGRLTRAITTTPTSTSQRVSRTGEGMYSLGSFSLSPTSLAIALASSSSQDVLSDRVNDIVERGYTYRRTSSGNEGGGSDASVGGV